MHVVVPKPLHSFGRHALSASELRHRSNPHPASADGHRAPFMSARPARSQRVGVTCHPFAFANAPRKATSARNRLAIAFHPAKDRPRMRSAALSHEGGITALIASSTPPLPVSTG